MNVYTNFDYLPMRGDVEILMQTKDFNKALKNKGGNLLQMRNGEVREIKWKNQGCGWVKVFTIPLPE